MLPFVTYTLHTGEALPPFGASMYEYIFAENGVLVRAEKKGLKAMIPVAEAHTGIRGLRFAEPYIEIDQLVPAVYLQQILALAQAMAIASPAEYSEGEPLLESLFYLIPEQGWQFVVPEQVQGIATVLPADDRAGSPYARALIEVHSHHQMRPVFSPRDNRDETGFRIYAVIGNIFTKPTLRVRVGIYGYRWEIPADCIFEMPDGIEDALSPFFQEDCTEEIDFEEVVIDE